jgi:hypothetical protein
VSSAFLVESNATKEAQSVTREGRKEEEGLG